MLSTKVMTIGHGEFVGEQSLSGRPDALTVRALSDVGVVVLASDALHGLATRSQAFATDIERVVQARAAAVARQLSSQPGRRQPIIHRL